MRNIQYTRAHTGRQGFALVISLVLMGFVLMLTLALQISLGVELKVTENDKQKEQARQNALLGLTVAMGELQKHAGPDRRITTRAEILDTTPEDSSEITGILHPYWTGVWNPDGTLRTWLVSGNNQLPLFHNATNSSLNDTNSRELVRETSLNANNAVRAPLVDIPPTAGRAGAYAYWIADEGIKAKANLYQSPTNTITNAALRLPETSGINQLSSLGWFPLSDRSSLARLSSQDQLNILEDEWSSNGSSIREHFHDLTYHSYGLPANTRDGGLRLDLTAALDSSATAPSGQIFERIINRPGYVGTAYTAAQDPGGPTWEQLRSWANSTGTGSLSVGGSTDTEIGYAPLISAFELYLLPTYDEDTREVSIHLMPAVTLWNPYNHPLDIANYTLIAGETHGDSSSFNYFNRMPDEWYLQLMEASGSYETGTSEQHLLMAQLPETSPLIFNIPSVSLAPGEALTFTPSGNTAYQTSPTPAQNILNAGIHPGASFHLPAGQSGSPRLVDLDPVTNEPIADYRIELSTRDSISLQLLRRMGPSAFITLSEVLHLNAHTNDTPAPATMPTFSPGSPTELADTERAHAVGIKATRTFVNNQTAQLPQARLKWLAQNNPRARTQGALPLYYQGSYEIDNPSNNPSFISTLEIDGTDQSYGLTGVGYSEAGSLALTTLFEVPEARGHLFSIGELMHAPLYYWNDSSGTDEDRVRDRMAYSRFDNLIPAYAIGNSLADPTIPLGALYRDWDDHSPFQGLHYDYSYLLNEALWDRYFFSSWIPANTDPQNPRLTRKPTATPTPGYRESATNLMIDGAFNVNSTSVEAWKALLASFIDQDVQLADGSTVTNADRSPYLRLRQPQQDAATGGPGTSEAYNGYAYLDSTQDQIQRLAEEIVLQVKLRGPFTSLSDFVNRSLDNIPGTTQDERLRGALAEAIERSGINSNLQPASNYLAEPLPGTLQGYEDDAAAGWLTENIPGWLSQADLLARLGSVISTRSDTFRVRVYGETLNPITGRVEARAWGEAILQRDADYVNPGDNAAETPFEPAEAAAAGYPALTTPNREMGRGINLVSFRWLNENEL